MEIEKEIKQKKFKSEYQKLVVNIMFTGSWLSLMSNQRLKTFGISQEQFNVLRILRGQHPLPASVLLIIERMIDKSSNASRIVEKLRIKDLVSRKECPSDRRQVEITITEKGLALLGDIDQDQELFESVLCTLTEAEARELNRLLDKLRG